MDCPKCQKVLQEGDNFCANCGEPRPPTAETVTDVISAAQVAESKTGATAWAVGAILLIILLMVAAVTGSPPSTKADKIETASLAEQNLLAAAPSADTSAADTETAPATMDAASDELTESAGEDTGLGLTPAQMNARRSAISYLDMSGFSREGLIQQLSSEYGSGYSREDAEAAVDSLEVDWRDNAARSAKQYLDMTGFSCSKLIEQLSSEHGSKYTLEEARYGATAAGAC